MVVKKIHSDVIKSNIVQIMLVRKLAILQGDMTEEEIDSLINETGREWMVKTEDMDETDVMLEMMKHTLERKTEIEKTKAELNM